MKKSRWRKLTPPVRSEGENLGARPLCQVFIALADALLAALENAEGQMEKSMGNLWKSMEYIENLCMENLIYRIVNHLLSWISMEKSLDNLWVLSCKDTKKCGEATIYNHCFSTFNGNSSILKWRYVSTIFQAIFCGDSPLHRPKK